MQVNTTDDDVSIINPPTQYTQALVRALDGLSERVGPLHLRALGQSEGQVVIEREWGEATASNKLPPGWALGCGDIAQNRRQNRWCAFCPQTHHTNQLAPIDRDLTRSYSTAGYHAFLCDHEQILGHIVTHDTPPHVRGSRELLTEVRRVLVSWHDRKARHEEVAHVLLTASGRLLSWSEGARTLLGASWEETAQKMRDRIDDPSLPPLIVGGYVARWSPMSRGQRTAHLVSFSRPEPLEIDWSHALRPQQLAIAKLVTTGLDNPQIAHELGISRNTIKYHLKQIYARLRVSSRTELAELLDQDAEGCVARELRPLDRSELYPTTQLTEHRDKLDP